MRMRNRKQYTCWKSLNVTKNTIERNRKQKQKYIEVVDVERRDEKSEKEEADEQVPWRIDTRMYKKHGPYFAEETKKEKEAENWRNQEKNETKRKRDDDNKEQEPEEEEKKKEKEKEREKWPWSKGSSSSSMRREEFKCSICNRNCETAEECKKHEKVCAKTTCKTWLKTFTEHEDLRRHKVAKSLEDGHEEYYWSDSENTLSDEEKENERKT